MPTYDYNCKECGSEHEIFHSMSEGPMKECPACGKDGLEKQISAGSGIIFKGTGFYETDYKRAGSKSEGDSKPAAKSGGGCGSGCACC